MNYTLTFILCFFSLHSVLAQCNLVLDSVVQQNVSCNGLSDGEFTAYISGGSAPYTFNTGESFSELLPAQPFNSNVINNNTTAPTNVWFSPGSCVGGAAFVYNSGIGCPAGAAVYNGTFSGFGGCFLRSPTVNMNGIDEAVMQFDFSNSFTASRPNDRLRIYIWVNGGFQSSLPTTINGNAGNTLFFTELRTCQAIEARINLSSIPTNSRSDLMVYFEANCGYNNCSPFQAIIDNIAIGQGAPGQASATFENLPADIYPLVITDAEGCTLSAEVEITQPAVLTSSVTVQDVSTVNGMDGEIVFSTNGGTPPYSITWNTVPPLVVNGLSNIAAGSYSFTITDVNNCLANVSAVVGGPDCSLLNLDLESITNPTCNNPEGGSFQLNATGGLEPYTFSVNEVEYLTPLINQLQANDYFTSVVDAAGCTFSSAEPITLSLPDSPALLINVSNASTVGGDDGSAQAVINGGTPPYIFAWSNGDSSPTVENLTSGLICLNVVDANGCGADVCEFIDNPDCSSFVISSIETVNPSCFESFDGSISVTLAGGLGPFQYELNQVISETEGLFEGLNAGIYELFIVDQAICILTAEAELFSQGPEMPEINQIDNVLETGIYEAYQWYMDGIEIFGQVNQTLLLSASGNYSVQVFDATGCGIFSEELEVIFTSKMFTEGLNFRAYPNPSNDILRVELNHASETCEVRMTDISGKLVFENTYFTPSFSIPTASLENGVYILFLKSDKGIMQTKAHVSH